MRILGIDPGTLRTGFGAIDMDQGKIKVVEFGCISCSSKLLISKRFVKVFSELKQVIERTKPDCVAIETLFYCKNPSTAFKLGEVRGVTVLVAELCGLEIYEYEPRRVKQAVVGYGAAHKSQVQKMVASILNLKVIPGPEDISDALAMAICHANHVKIAEKINKGF